MSNSGPIYKDILKRKNDWPIVNLSQNKNEFLRQVAQSAFDGIIERSGEKTIRELLETTIYREKQRIINNPWRVDPKDELAFWKYIQTKHLNCDERADGEQERQKILLEIIDRYCKEIVGNFNKSSYRFAKSFTTFGFARLLNATRVKGFKSIISRQLDLHDQIHVVGHPEQLRKLAQIGTVVLVPTHFSNLDSILIGWVIQFLGLPPFIYGAGLNLFNIKILAYFMNSLGAYKLDRRKKNPIYLETLKVYSNMALQWGCHSLFFPGGTRSRSGQIESSLKLGLLSTTIEAQRALIQKNSDDSKPIFIVPVVINYQFTLEAPLLINEHLKITGQERYFKESDAYSNSKKITSFLFKFFTKGSDISVSIGRGLDVLGNYVNDEGKSIDQNGNEINIKDYFVKDGNINIDKQREHTYVQILSKRIVEEYYKNNRVYSSHLVAYTAFKMLERSKPKLDLYNLLRLSVDDLEIDYEAFKSNFKKLRKVILKIHAEGNVGVNPRLQKKAEDAISYGLANVGMYHAKPPLVKIKDKIVILNPSTLYYYHNRLEGYGLEKHI
ncbi:MAG: 1-acyl-sn-glycerol-3-phosphate acyltransferase [Flammeovirgaceae bacterium]|jgi:glycerol-3-phosphate O-acyltransferase|nr:1-acyl-sn-glycerol-3-phosphate acyltransferase [Flammeovirgaceae bacterium]|tara:strand:- start:8801 stop:10465 length:1665 start_codon:yes stop_codon:yes gene_type:complete